MTPSLPKSLSGLSENAAARDGAREAPPALTAALKRKSPGKPRGASVLVSGITPSEGHREGGPWAASAPPLFDLGLRAEPRGALTPRTKDDGRLSGECRMNYVFALPLAEEAITKVLRSGLNNAERTRPPSHTSIVLNNPSLLIGTPAIRCCSSRGKRC
jgi:hypothetical protein